MRKEHSSSLFSHRALILLVLSVASLSGISCDRGQPVAQIPIGTVMQAVREYSPGQQTFQVALAKAPAAQTPSSSRDLYDGDEAYQAHIAVIFLQGDFAQLEQEAQRSRVSKARLTGGVWKLHGLYDGVVRPSSQFHPEDNDWDAQLVGIKKWIAAYPNSATARIALADFYTVYAWAARGVGYSDSVTRSGWKLFGQRIELAKSVLLEAARLKEKCPYWYTVMQEVALAEGWDKPLARELFEKAVEFEPGFLQYYREYAYFLLPKWYGESGEVEQFAEEISQKVGGPVGDTLYFEAASEIACQYDLNESPVPKMSWEKIKQGYAAIDRLYGQSNRKANRFAYMAYLLGDKPAAREAFAFIGDRREPQVWSNDQFAFVRAWAAAS
jgi:hypothetical protein